MPGALNPLKSHVLVGVNELPDEGEATTSRMPKVLRELGEKASQRHRKRTASPALKVTLRDGHWWFDSPFADEDEEHWVALMFEAFATRSQATFVTFMTQLAELCSTTWSESGQAWHPSEDELVAAVQIVRSARPRNEAEACLAAQMVAVHIMQMKMSAQALKKGWMEPRTCAIAGKLARTFAVQLETMAKLRGKGSRQRITVRKHSQHEHKHIHLHQGGLENGNQPHEPSGGRARDFDAIDQSKGRGALPRPNTTEQRVPISRDEGQETVPAARRRGRIRGAKG